MKPRRMMLAIAGGMIAIGMPGGPVCAQLPAEPADARPPFQFRTAADCVRCHRDPEAAAELGGAGRRAMNEAAIWSTEDKHAHAYQALAEPRAMRMGKLLGQDVYAESTGCIPCHTTNVDHARWLDPDPHRVETGLAEGVGCESCHGASSQWYDEHMLPRWKSLSPDHKAQQYGFVPLRNSQARAEVCLSCHVGNARQHRVMTHAMYAAGHPPLAGFELESATDRMPPHWAVRDEVDGDRFPRTRHALTASLVGMRWALELAASRTDAEQRTPWPELARLDCFGCHHNLTPNGWRQRRTLDAASGRTELAIGCLPLLRVAALATGEARGVQELDAVLGAAKTPFHVNVFGDIDQLRAGAPEAIAKLQQMEVEISRQRWDGPQAARLFHHLVNRPPGELLDYDSARQLAGAATVIFGELRRDRSGANGPGAPSTATALAEQFHFAPDGQPFLEASLSDLFEQRVRFTPEEFRGAIRLLQTAEEQ